MVMIIYGDNNNDVDIVKNSCHDLSCRDNQELSRCRPGAGASAVFCSSCRRRLPDGTAVEATGRRKMLPYTVKSTGKDPVPAKHKVRSCLSIVSGFRD